MGFHCLATDWAIWIKEDAYIACHVDDMMVSGTQEFLDKTFAELGKEMKLQNLGPLSNYLGMRIQHDRINRLIFLDQSEYTKEILKEFNMQNAASIATPMVKDQSWIGGEALSDSKKKLYQKIIGSLLYLMNATRSDICFATIRLSQFTSSPTETHWAGVKKVLRYLRGTSDIQLVLGKRKVDDENIDLCGYFDSAFADLPSRRSTCGYVFFFKGSIISWESRVQKTVALSNTEAEYMAGTEACRELKWITSLL